MTSILSYLLPVFVLRYSYISHSPVSNFLTNKVIRDKELEFFDTQFNKKDSNQEGNEIVIEDTKEDSDRSFGSGYLAGISFSKTLTLSCFTSFKYSSIISVLTCRPTYGGLDVPKHRQDIWFLSSC